MKKYIVTILFAALLHIACSAQQIAIGKIGNQTIDNNLLKGIQSVWPEFTFVHDTIALKQILAKLYSTNAVLAADAKKTLSKTDSIFTEIEEAKQLLEIKMLADYFLQKELATITATEQETRNYYNENKQRFTTRALASFYQIQLIDTGKPNMTTIKKLLDERKGLSGTALQNSTVKSDDFSISYESFTLTPENKNLQDIFTTLSVGKLSPLFKDGSGYVMYYLIAFKPEQVKSYESAKLECTNELLNIKRQQLIDKYTKLAQEKYPIQLNPSFFSSNEKVNVK